MFSGIGGFEKAIERVFDNEHAHISKKSKQVECRQGREWSTDKQGVQFHSGNGTAPLCVGYSEIDKYAIQIYEKHFNHKNYGDCTKIIASELPDFDLLVGGFPCQAFSVAGKRRGFEDTRGTLFFEVARILKEKQPRYLLLENVKGLLSHDGGRTFQTILGILSDIGYSVEWQVLNSKDFGVPQNRERVFIIGYFGGFPRRKVFPIRSSSEEALEYVGAVMSEQNQKWLEDGKQFSRNFPQGQRVYSDKGISATIASQAGGLGAKTGLYAVGMTRREINNYRVREDGIVGTLDANYYKGLANQERPGVAIPVLTPDRLEKRQNGRRFKENGDPSFTLTGQDKHGITDGYRIRRLTPTECERLQSFPDGWTKEGTEGLISDTQRYKCLGNAVTVNVVEAVISRLL